MPISGRPADGRAADHRHPVGQPEGRPPLAEQQHHDGGQHDELAVGEVDRPRRLPQQREPHRGDGEDRPGRQPEKLICKNVVIVACRTPPTSAEVAAPPTSRRATQPLPRCSSNPARRGCRAEGPSRRSHRRRRRPTRCSSAVDVAVAVVADVEQQAGLVLDGERGAVQRVRELAVVELADPLDGLLDHVDVLCP